MDDNTKPNTNTSLLIDQCIETINTNMQMQQEFMNHQRDMLEKISAANIAILKGADERLAHANDMVLSLSRSTNCMAEALCKMKEMMVHLEERYTHHIDQAVTSRNEAVDAYKNLHNKYDAIQDDLLATLKELARRPTIQNNPTK